MDTTSGTLLNRVKDFRDATAWRDFFALYFPLLRKYARMRGLRAADAEEVAQECMHTLARHLRSFEYTRSRGRFRGFLRTLVENKIVDLHRRRPQPFRFGKLERVAAPAADDEVWDRVWLREHLTYCIERLESRCSDHTVQAFKLYALQDWPVEKVCRALGLTANQVYLAKTRMIRRLRQDMARLIGNVA
ncbi:MAG: sigma-70 family RNA polymerase sigma factor [Planctomycetota bacterium]